MIFVNSAMRTTTAKAFTIVELLVAISIVVILIGLLTAAANNVRQSGEAAACLSNIRQLAAANIAYAADNGGQFAPAQDARNRMRWHGYRRNTREGFDPAKGHLSPYLGGEGRVMMCPTLKKQLSEDTSTFELGTGGYGYNHTYIGGSPHKFYPTNFEPRRMTHIQNLSRTVMFTDAAFPRKDGIQEYAYCEPFFHVEPGGELGGRADPSVHFRHNGRAHVAWCDGHVTAEEPSKIEGSNVYGGDNEEYQVGWFGPEKENGYWNPASPAAEGEYFRP